MDTEKEISYPDLEPFRETPSAPSLMVKSTDKDIKQILTQLKNVERIKELKGKLKSIDDYLSAKLKKETTTKNNKKNIYYFYFSAWCCKFFCCIYMFNTFSVSSNYYSNF